MLILNLWGEIRELFLRLDMVAFSFIDNIYSLFTAIASESLISETIVKQVLNNVYVLVGIFAFFRIAVLLINSIINPDALNKQGAGLSKIFVNTVIMLVLLVFTPTLFQMSRDLSKEVVEGNYIQKLFININDSKNTLEPGKEMQRIAIGAVITPEEGFVDETGEITCSGDCEKALQCLNTINGVEGATGDECMKDNGVAWGKLADYNGIREKDANGEKVYVYNYKPLVLTVVGWTITYILLSFTFDVAKRMIELAILEIVSPLFIATIVDPKSMQSGPFKKWLKTLGNSYGGLFLRIAAISIMLLCVRLLSYWHPAAEIGGIGKLIVLIAFLIFIKQLPKWFSNMLGMDGDGTGLGDLGIGKKIGGAALIGGLATKAGHGLVGNAVTGLGNARDAIRDNHNKKKAAYQNGLSKGIGKKQSEARKGWYKANGLDKETYAQKRKKLNQARKEARAANDVTVGRQAAKVFGGAVIGGIEGFKAGFSADSVKSAATAAKGKIGNVNGVSLGLNTDTNLKKLGKKIGDGYNNFTNAVYGDPMKRFEAEDALTKRKTRESIYNTSAVTKNGLDLDKLAAGYNDVKKLGTDNISDLVAANYANAKGYNISYEKDAEGNYIKDSDGKRILKITDQSGNNVSVDDMVKEGSQILGSTGLTRLAAIQNQLASNALSESGSNAQYMNNLATSISNMQSNIGNISIPGLDTNGNININGTNLCFTGTNNPIKIDKESVRDLRIASEEASRQMNIENKNAQDPNRTQDERDASKEKVENYKNLITSLNQSIVMRTQLQGAVGELGELQERQENLEYLINSIGKVEVDTKSGEIDTTAGKTFASNSERETYLSKQNEKYEKINNPNKEN